MTPTELKQLVESTIAALTTESGSIEIHGPSAAVLAAALASAPLCNQEEVGPSPSWKSYGDLSPGECWVTVHYRYGLRLVLHSVPLAAVEGVGTATAGHVAS